ncbi:hypothetical protein [Stappia sp. MMSF_3263]|uniref:hypothetical protein n=1 Tax=Stappia sp. MMSF_3263 TaxID=3046693 RepID=UPI00273E9CE7|nr:hypothetical protein [Stappia sp. MMSF_3263]
MAVASIPAVNGKSSRPNSLSWQHNPPADCPADTAAWREAFDEMRDELKSAMPDAVRAQIPELASEVSMDTDVTAPSSSGPAADTGLAIDDDMIPSSFTSASVPGLTR